MDGRVDVGVAQQLLAPVLGQRREIAGRIALLTQVLFYQRALELRLGRTDRDVGSLCHGKPPDRSQGNTPGHRRFPMTATARSIAFSTTADGPATARLRTLPTASAYHLRQADRISADAPWRSSSAS